MTNSLDLGLEEKKEYKSDRQQLIILEMTQEAKAIVLPLNSIRGF